MEVIDRLKLFLNSNNIGSSEFADRCDISRPTVSQLLNGRNKKISNEIIDKIHSAYPSLSIMWLMFGEGVMFTHSSADLASADDFNAAQNSIFDDNLDVDTQNEPLVSVINAAAEQVLDPNGVVTEGDSCESKGEISALKSYSNDRKIVNIMVFYSDNSFESFKP